MERFGKYELLRRLGAGGMAEVFLAREPLASGIAKILVIKKIHPQLAESAQFRQMFEDEAKVAVNLNHPNIVQTFSYGELDRTYYLTMEYVEGVDLLRLLNACVAANERVPFGLAAYLGQQVAKALDYAHRRIDEYGEELGIVHRDISPQNILVSWDGMVKLVDFGIARARHVKEVEGVIKGKFAYMSPEQAAGDGVDARSDIFSMGVVLWELATNRSLFGSMKGKDALTAIRSGQVPSPRSVEPSVPDGFDEIILRCLQRAPDDRYETARDLHRALGKFFFELSAKEGQIFESGAMAAFMARIVPRGATAPALPREEALNGDSAKPRRELSSTRPVVVLEGELTGMSALRRSVGDSRAREVLLDFLRVTEHVAYKHGAHAERVDERGFAYVVGLSGDSEEAPLRAIRFALALIESLDGISRDLHPPLQIAIGVQRGSALVAGTIPGGSRDHQLAYQLVGHTAQVARRLSRDAMPGEVLVGGGVHRATRDEYRFEELEPVHLPEADTDPAASVGRMRVHRLLGVRPRAERLADPSGQRPLVGRAKELGALARAFRACIEEGRSRNLILLGDAGIGKRSIVDAFRNTLPPDVRVLRAAARPGLRDTPFSLVAEIARDALGVEESAEAREVKKRIETSIGHMFENEEPREARQAADAFGLLLGVKVPGAEEIDPGERRLRLHSAMRKVQRRLAQRGPLVVVLEDLHWADAQSYDLFVSLAREPVDGAVLSVATARPDERTESWVLDPLVTSLHVSELGEVDRRALVERRFADPSDVDPLTSRILERAGGNPFFVHELIESLTERGVLRADDLGLLHWVRRDEGVAVPTTVEAVVQGRLERLPAHELEVLRRGAVLGRLWRPDEAAALLETRAEAIATELKSLVRRGLVEQQTSGELSFRNLLVREVAYNGIAPELRVRLHLASARLLAKSPTFRRGLDDHRLAEHLFKAGDLAQAGKALIGAAIFARDNASSADAFALLTRALTLLPTSAHADRYLAHAEREQILRSWGRRPAQLREVHAMRRAAQAGRDSAGEVEATNRLGLLYLDVGRHVAAQRELDRALALARNGSDATGVSEALRLAATLQLNVGNNSGALELARQALSALDSGRGEHGKKQERPTLLCRAQALQVVGNVHVLMGRLREAVSTQAEALVIYRRLGARRLEAQTLSQMGWMLVGLGEFEEALVQYKRSLRLAQELGDRTGIGGKLASIGQAYSDLGDLERARRYLDKALELHLALDDLSGVCDARISLAQVALKERHPDEAIAALEQGHELALRTRGRYQEVRSLIYLAFARLQRGDDAAVALDLARRAVALAREGELANGEAYGLCAEAGALRALGNLDAARQSAEQAVALIDAGRDVDSPEEIFSCYATIAAEQGHLELSADVMRRAVGEVRKKARRIRDESWRRRYLASEPAASILTRVAATE